MDKKKAIAGVVGAAAGAVGAVAAAPFVLTAVGFTGAGIAAGSFAASMMSAAAVANGGGVAAGSLVAVLQSAGAAGLSAGGAAAVATAGGAVGGAVAGAAAWMQGVFGKKKPPSNDDDDDDDDDNDDNDPKVNSKKPPKKHAIEGSKDTFDKPEDEQESVLASGPNSGGSMADGSPITRSMAARSVEDLEAVGASGIPPLGITQSVHNGSANVDWKTTPDPEKAASLYRDKLLQEHKSGKPLHIHLDLSESVADRERALLCFYKTPNIWACPLNCTLDGDAAVGEGVKRHVLSMVMAKLNNGFELNLGNTEKTLLFEGEPGHLTPSTAQNLLDNNLFGVAGRMIAHCFFHGGPRLAGLSPAILHVLAGNPPETATVTINDCADIDIRVTIEMLQGSAELTEEEKEAVTDLAVSWDLPGPTEENRRWLMEKLLIHAVLGRTSMQVKQLKRGLKEAKVWPLIAERGEGIIGVLFPTRPEIYTPQMILERIIWPAETIELDSDDEQCNEDTKCRVAGYLRTFIEAGSSQQLMDLLKFWVGWEILPRELHVFILEDKRFPTSATCFQTLNLPGHYTDYNHFSSELQSCIDTCQYGFGLL